MPVPVDPFDDFLRPPSDESPDQRTLRLAKEEEARQVSAAIDASIKAERNARRKKRIVRLLLLGQSESGQYSLFYSLFTPPDPSIGKSTTLRRVFPSSLFFILFYYRLTASMFQNFKDYILQLPSAKSVYSGGQLYS